MKLGSLFDGSGGFPLAGVINGIEPVWASEIEPYPMRVTEKRFPYMKQLGDVTKICGAEIEPVDIITFGSPCQDLSVAGKQAGIHDGERSSLFFEAIRIIKEMRHATANEFPRFAVWENVPGAFSSNKGEDFKAVLQAFCELFGGGAAVPQPQGGKWKHAGCVVGDGFSIAWRQYDAQFWGVPQRRKRIYLIADFASERAGEILFKPESLRGDPAESRAPGENTTEDAPGSVRGGCLSFPWANSADSGMSAGEIAPTIKATRNGEPGIVYSLQGNAVDRDAKMNGCGWSENVAHCLNTQDRHAVAFMGGQGAKARSIAWKDDEKTPTLRAANSGSNQVPDVVYDCRGYGDGRIVPTITGDHQERVTDYTSIVTYIQPSFGNFRRSDKGCALKATDGRRVDPGAVVLEKAKPPRKYIVRRLTPLECCRLQGFPDWWMDDVDGSDSAKYKMWGNGIALPCAADVIRRVAEEIRRPGNDCVL